MIRENRYRTHTTEMITEDCLNKNVRVAGWVENIRDHGGIKFIDLRDHYGVVQITMQQNEQLLEGIHREFTVSVEGKVINRDPSTYNDKIKTGRVEIVAETLTVLGAVTENLPFEVDTSKNNNEDIRLKYRFPFAAYAVYAREDDRRGISGAPDPYFVHFLARGRPRFSYTQQKAPRKVLRSSAGAPDL